MVADDIDIFMKWEQTKVINWKNIVIISWPFDKLWKNFLNQVITKVYIFDSIRKYQIVTTHSEILKISTLVR